MVESEYVQKSFQFQAAGEKSAKYVDKIKDEKFRKLMTIMEFACDHVNFF